MFRGVNVKFKPKKILFYEKVLISVSVLLSRGFLAQFCNFWSIISVQFLLGWMGPEKSFPTIYYKPNSDLRVRSYGENTKLGQAAIF